MTTPAIETRDLSRWFGALAANANVNLRVMPGEVHAVIGPNGAGKTTFISLLAGTLLPSGGQVLLSGRDVTRLPSHQRARRGLGRSFQKTNAFPNLTCFESVRLAAQAREPTSFRFIRDALRSRHVTERALAALARVNLAEKRRVTARSLSHGEQRQLEIGMVLAAEPTTLLLDEPMAGMGAEESARMVALIQSLKGSHTVVLVEHDMDAVFACADRISVFVYGRVIATGTPAEIQASPEVRKAYLGDGPA